MRTCRVLREEHSTQHVETKEKLAINSEDINRRTTCSKQATIKFNIVEHKIANTVSKEG